MPLSDFIENHEHFGCKGFFVGAISELSWLGLGIVNIFVVKITVYVSFIQNFVLLFRRKTSTVSKNGELSPSQTATILRE